MKKFKFDEAKKCALLKYMDSIAVIYYNRHKDVYEKDSKSVKDLKQEAKIVCLSMIDLYGHMDGKKEFDLKKFTCRAVGWRMNDLLRQAIKNSNNTIRISDIPQFPDEQDANGIVADLGKEPEEYAHWTKDDFLSTLSGKALFGFDIEEIYSHFNEKELTILKKMVDYNSRKDVHKSLGYKNNSSTRTIWLEKVLPKLKRLLKHQLKEYR